MKTRRKGDVAKKTKDAQKSKEWIIKRACEKAARGRKEKRNKKGSWRVFVEVRSKCRS